MRPQEFGLAPQQFVDVLALAGDASGEGPWAAGMAGRGAGACGRPPAFLRSPQQHHLPAGRPCIHPCTPPCACVPTDNIPGVAGIGPKTAVSLLKEHGGLDGVLAAAAAGGALKPKRAAASLASGEHCNRQAWLPAGRACSGRQWVLSAG